VALCLTFLAILFGGCFSDGVHLVWCLLFVSLVSVCSLDMFAVASECAIVFWSMCRCVCVLFVCVRMCEYATY